MTNLQQRRFTAVRLASACSRRRAERGCRAGLKSRCWVTNPQHRLFTAVRFASACSRRRANRGCRAGLKSRCWVASPQHRLFTAVRPTALGIGCEANDR